MYRRLNFLSYFRCLNTAALACVLLALSGCAIFGGGGDVPVLRASGYHTSAPGDWKKKDQRESDLAYQLPSGANVILNSSCGHTAKVSLEMLTRQLFIGSRNIKVSNREKIMINGGDGLHTAATADFDGAGFFLDICVTSHRDCIFDFSLISPGAPPEREVADFLKFVKGFSLPAESKP